MLDKVAGLRIDLVWKVHAFGRVNEKIGVGLAVPTC